MWVSKEKTMLGRAADDVGALIRQGRGARLDWLMEGASIDSIASILAALANSSGGTLILGVVGPLGTPIGLRDPDAARDRLLQAALTLEPSLIFPLPRFIKYQERQFVIAEVPPGMPHIYAYDGRFLMRQGMENVPLKARDMRRLLFERGEISFETDIIRDARLDNLDWEKAKAYVTAIGGLTGDDSVQSTLQRRGCLAEVGGRMQPTHAGMLLFGKDPQQFIRGAYISAARFSGDTMSDRFVRQDFMGSLPDQLTAVENFLKSNLRVNAQLGRSMTRSESYEYPLEAARELVINAVAHRDYSIAGEGIRLFLFRDRMEVTSPGVLPGPMTLDNIKEERFSRNPVIVQVLADLKFIERLGYGVDRVYDLMRTQRLKPPQFEETDGGFRVRLYNTVEETDTTPTPNILPVNGFYRGEQVNPRQEAALTHLHTGNTRITNSDLQALCPNVHAETIRRDLADLVTKNILKKLGEKRGSYYMLADQAATSGASDGRTS